MDKGASLRDRATHEQSQQAVSAVPVGIPSADGWVPFSVRDRVRRAIADPGSFIGARYRGDDWVEDLSHWQARAAIDAMLQEAARSPHFAQAIEARRAETQGGSVHESAVGNADAPISPSTTEGAGGANNPARGGG